MSEDLRSELEKYLEALDIQTRCVEHPPVKTRDARYPVASYASGDSPV